MDQNTIIFVIVLTALSFGAIIWLEIYSRRNERMKSLSGEGKEQERIDDSDRAA